MVHWIPLESNPDVFNDYIQKLGVDKKWNFTDVYGFDPDLLMMIPQPCLAFILLYKISEQSEAFRADEEAKLTNEALPPNVFWMKQTIGNACGTIGILHALSNARTKCGISNDGILGTFLSSVKDESGQEIGRKLEASEEIANLHASTSTSTTNQTSAPTSDTKIEDHFIALVHVDGVLYELDGRKNRPISHGPSSDETFVMDAANVCKKFISRDTTGSNFAAMALADMS